MNLCLMEKTKENPLITFLITEKQILTSSLNNSIELFEMLINYNVVGRFFHKNFQQKA